MNIVKSPVAPVLRAYDGAHHSLPDGCPKVLTTFSGDESSTVAYAFNSLGFRGEEFQPEAERHIFVSGCSIAFGLGLDYADAWVSVFRRGYAEIHHTPEAGINLQNFSTSGSSNGYIARTLIGQCARFRPALALATLTFPDRAELLHNRRSYNIGRWCLTDTFDGGAEEDGHDRELRRMIRAKGQAHYELYSPLAGEQDLLKNALLLQLFFQTREIPFLIGIIRTGHVPSDDLLTSWRDLLDPRRVFTIPLRECSVDASASPGHPGPAGSRVIAEKFLSRYRQLDARIGPSIEEPAFEPWTSPATNPPQNDPNVYPLF